MWHHLLQTADIFLLIVMGFSLGSYSQPILAPAHNTWRQDAIANERYRRGYVNDDAIEDENVDRTSFRRQEDHFADSLDNGHQAKIQHGFLGDGGLISSSKGHQLDRQNQAIDRSNFENDHLAVRRHGSSLTDAQQATGSRAGRMAYRTALGGPYQSGDYAYDIAEFDRLDAERLGRDTDYLKDADRTLVQYDKGAAERTAEAGVLIAQDGALGAGTDGFERGSAKTERETGTLLSQSLLERGGSRSDFNKGYDAAGRVRAKRASTAFGPNGALAADLLVKQDAWDRGNLNRRDQVRFHHAAHDNLADTSKERSKADVGLELTIGQGIPGDITCADRRARAANAHDRIIERDTGDRLRTNSESEILQTFDIGGRSVIDGNGVAIGR